MAAVAGTGAAILAAIGLALLDLYLTGHGYGSITREVIGWDGAGVHMSPADVAMLCIALAAACGAWYGWPKAMK